MFVVVLGHDSQYLTWSLHSQESWYPSDFLLIGVQVLGPQTVFDSSPNKLEVVAR